MCSKNEVLVSSDTSGQMWNLGVWDPETGTILTTYKGGATVPGTFCRVGGDYFLSANKDKPLLNVWQINRNEQLALRLFTPGKCSALTCSPSGAYLLAAVEENISIWQTSTGRLWRVLSSHYQTVSCLQFTRDGSHFVSGGGDGQVLCWSLAVVLARRNIPGLKVSQVGKPDPKWCWRDHALPVTGLHVTHGGVHAKVASVSKDQTCKLFSIVSGQLLLSVSFPVSLSSVTMGPTCDAIFVGGDNGDVMIVKLGAPPRTVAVSSESQDVTVLKGHSGSVTTLSLSLDGSKLSSGGQDATVRIWHISSGQCVRVLDHKGPVSSLEYMIPPPAMLNTDLWKPTRKLVPLQKGFDENEPFTSNVLSREPKPFRRLEPETLDAAEDESVRRESAAENDGKLAELAEINQQLYQFSVKHILHQKL